MGDCKQRLETMEVMKAALEREKEDLEQQLSAEQMVCIYIHVHVHLHVSVLLKSVSGREVLINFFPHS